MDEYQIPKRANKVERETVEEHCSFCQGQMVRAALDAARPLCLSGHDMHTTHTHTSIITSACLCSSGQSQPCFSESLICLRFSFLFFFSSVPQSVDGIERKFEQSSNQTFFVGILAARVYMSCSIYTGSHRQKHSGWKLEHTWNNSLEINIQVKTSSYINPTWGRFACYFLCY